MKLYTLGTSNRTEREFLEILKKYKIELVIDVRRFPTSKFFPHFQKENLKKLLEKNKVEYYHIEKLGGFREEGYQEYTKKREFKEGIEELIKILKNKVGIIICAEKFPWKCHRYLVAQELAKKGFEIIHILTKGQFWNPLIQPKKIKLRCQKN